MIFSVFTLLLSLVLFLRYSPENTNKIGFFQFYLIDNFDYLIMSLLCIAIIPFVGYTFVLLTQNIIKVKETIKRANEATITTNTALREELSIDIIKGINNGLPKNLRDALKYYYDPGEIESFRRDFHSVMHELFNPKAEELMVPIREFIHKSIGEILQRGFIQISSGFNDYRRESNRMVRRLYKSPSANDVWMICLFNPLSYLVMTVMKTEKKIKPDHLILFNGSDPDNNYEYIEKVSTTDTIRISYLKRHDLEHVFSEHKYQYTDKDGSQKISENIYLGDLYLFSYLFFLFFNTEINLSWRWYNYYHEEDMPKGMKNGDEDFMIFKKHYLWRYNVPKKILSICWKWDNLSGTGKELMTHGIELFEKKVGEGINFHHGMLHMISEIYRGDDRDFLEKIKTSFESLQDRINSKTSTLSGVEKDYFELILSSIQLALTKYDWDSDVVENEILSLFRVKPEQRKMIYKYLFSSKFEVTVKDVFPEICAPATRNFDSEPTYSKDN